MRALNATRHVSALLAVSIAIGAFLSLDGGWAAATTIQAWLVSPAGGAQTASSETIQSSAGQPASGLVRSSTSTAYIGYWPLYVDPAATSAVLDGGPPPHVLRLHAARPSPFRERTRLAFDIPAEKTLVRLQVYDVSGRLVTTLVEDNLRAGHHELTWDGRDSAGNPARSGFYFARLQVGAWRASTRVLLVR